MDQGLISLLYKKGVRELKNWRPIMFLNFDYKLMTKVLVEHYKSVIGAVIHNNQLYTAGATDQWNPAADIPCKG